MRRRTQHARTSWWFPARFRTTCSNESGRGTTWSSPIRGARRRVAALREALHDADGLIGSSF